MPIPLGPEGSKTIVFRQVLFRIPSGKLIGGSYWLPSKELMKEYRWQAAPNETLEYNVAVVDELRGHGYDVRDTADAIFSDDSTVKTRYLLAGVVHELSLNHYFKKDRRRYVISAVDGYGESELELEVQLFDAVERQMLFERRYPGRGQDTGQTPNPVPFAVVDAIRHALADAEFVDLVAINRQSEAVDSEREVLEIASCSTAETADLPEDMESVLGSVVRIRVGSIAGSGVIVSEDGYVLTAAHLVEEGRDVMVGLASGVELPAKVERLSGSADVALIKLPGRGYPCLQSVKSLDQTKAGMDLYIVGDPMGGQGGQLTVSRGVVSGTPEHAGREFIQTDASVNPGNSGGPMLDRSGALHGIVVTKIVGFAFEGLGFGIPIAGVEQSLGLAWKALEEDARSPAVTGDAVDPAGP